MAGPESRGSGASCDPPNVDFPHKAKAIIGGVHTHPEGGPPSGADFRKVIKTGIVEHIVLPNGRVYRLAPTAETAKYLQRNPQAVERLPDELNAYFGRMRVKCAADKKVDEYSAQATACANSYLLGHEKTLAARMAIKFTEYGL